MLDLNLEALFAPGLLAAFRQRWGSDPRDGERELRNILALFAEVKDNPDPAGTREQRKAWLANVAVALVGEEPDFNAWVEALARGSFDLRAEVLYGRAPGKGSPSRALLRQRELVDSLIDSNLPEEERELIRLAYADAMRLMLASLILRELRASVTAKMAIGVGWPLMVAAHDHLDGEAKRLLHHFGDDTDFLQQIAAAVTGGITNWVSTRHGGLAPAPGRSAKYRYKLPPGMNVHGALSYLDRATLAVDDYRALLWKAVGGRDMLHPLTGSGRDAASTAADDALRLQDAIAGQHGATGETLDESTGRWAHFTEANEEHEPFVYSSDDIGRLRAMLPILSKVQDDFTLAGYAAGRASLRERASRSVEERGLQREIREWTRRGYPPPAKLRPECAGYFEEEVCLKYAKHYWSVADKWPQLGFGPLTWSDDLLRTLF